MLVRAAIALLAAGLAAAQIPAPLTHFGHAIGADRTVLDWDKVVSYFRLLEKSGDRIRVDELGKTVEGRPFIVAILASADTLRNLPRHIETQRRLADPRLTTNFEAEALIARGKTVVLITCSIHSTELASTHTAVEFAYRLLTEDTPHFRAILENTIFILVPSLNPDGVDIVTGWYRKTLGTPYEGTLPPELYHKYVGHDNNRDWYMYSQPETQLTVAKLHNVWHPQIVYDVHQQDAYASRLFVPPWMDPIEPNIDPLLMQETNMIGTAMAADLTAAGKTGIVIHASYDFWSPGRQYQAYHGSLRILTESASARLASPITVTPEEIDHSAPGYNPRERSWNYLEPWTGGTWRLRDIIDYQVIAWESCLYQAAIRREDLLRNFYRIGCRALQRRSPYAFQILVGQRDPGATRKLIELLRFGMVEVEEAPDGSYLVRMEQPYGGFAKTLLERQDYPDLRVYPGGPPRRPYDVTAHTLPLLMGVEVRPIESAPKEWGPRTQPSAKKLSASDTDSWVAINRIWNSGGAVWRDRITGDFSDTDRGGDFQALPRPRIGLYKTFVPSMDEGWSRWLLEQFGFRYTSLRNPDIQAGNLRQSFDVLVFPDQLLRVLTDGYRRGSMPKEYTGGLEASGSKTLREFAEQGGTLVFLNHSTEYAIEKLGVKATQALRGVSNQEFYSPGSLLNVSLDKRHPLTLGLPSEIAIWSEGSPAWQTEETTVGRYPESKILASGWLLGEKMLAGKSALVDARIGKGHVILFGMRPQYRAQSYQTFKLFFNALVYF